MRSQTFSMDSTNRSSLENQILVLISQDNLISSVIIMITLTTSYIPFSFLAQHHLPSIQSLTHRVSFLFHLV